MWHITRVSVNIAKGGPHLGCIHFYTNYIPVNDSSNRILKKFPWILLVKTLGIPKLKSFCFLCNADWFKTEGKPSSLENLLERLFKRGKLIWKWEIQTPFHTFGWGKQTHISNSECRSRFNLALPLLIFRFSPTDANLEIDLKNTSIQNSVLYPFSFDV